jgi:hypothetical protein
MAAPHKLVVVGDDLLVSLAKKEVVLAQFPFMAPLAAAGRRCSCKGQKDKLAAKVAAVKQAIVQMPEAQKTVFKKMVNAQRVGVNYVVGGRSTSTEF